MTEPEDLNKKQKKRELENITEKHIVSKETSITVNTGRKIGKE